MNKNDMKLKQQWVMVRVEFRKSRNKNLRANINQKLVPNAYVKTSLNGERIDPLVGPSESGAKKGGGERGCWNHIGS